MVYMSHTGYPFPRPDESDDPPTWATSHCQRLCKYHGHHTLPPEMLLAAKKWAQEAHEKSRITSRSSIHQIAVALGLRKLEEFFFVASEHLAALCVTCHCLPKVNSCVILSCIMRKSTVVIPLLRLRSRFNINFHYCSGDIATKRGHILKPSYQVINSY